MRAAPAGFVGLGIFKNMAEKPSMHLFYRKVIDLLEVLDIANFIIVEREAIKAISIRINVHGAIVCTTEIKSPIFPIIDIWHRLVSMVKKPFH